MSKAAAKKVKRNKDGSVNAVEYLEALNGGPLTFGQMMNAQRVGDEESLAAYAKRLGVSSGHLCDIEKDRRTVSPERAARWARTLGYSEAQFVRLALQAAVDAAGIKLKVSVEKAA